MTISNARVKILLSRAHGIDLDIEFALRVILFSTIAALLTWLTLQIIHLTTVLQLPFRGTVYVAFCLILAPLAQTINENDIKTLRRVLNRVPIMHTIVEPFLKIEEKTIKRLKKEKM